MDGTRVNLRFSNTEREAARKAFGRLTPTENEILAQLLDAKSTKQIAAQRGISPRTVETHRLNLMNKLGVNNTQQVFRLYLALLPDGSKASA